MEKHEKIAWILRAHLDKARLSIRVRPWSNKSSANVIKGLAISVILETAG
jgi:hypothetical protein